MLMTTNIQPYFTGPVSVPPSLSFVFILHCSCFTYFIYNIHSCRCLGILLQKLDDRMYVREKIDLMYKQANILVPTNRLGLAKGMGLVS